LRKQPLLWFVLFCLFAIALGLSACGDSPTPVASGVASAPGKSSSGATAGGSGAAAANPPAANATPSSSSSSSSNDVATPGVGVDERKIIRNGNISILAADVQETLAKITALANTEGGLVFSTSTSHAEDNLSANITLQIPPTKFDETMTAIRKLAVKVTAEDSSSQDVTEEFVDNEAAIKNLSQTEQQLNSFLSKATTVSDVLAVQKEITDVRGQIDKLQGRQNYLARKVSLSTLVISISPANNVVPSKPAQAWDFSRSLQQAWNTSLTVLQGLADVLLTLVAFLWLLPFILLGFWWLRKSSRLSITTIKSVPPTNPPPPTPNVES
jgi:hypothetical protein